MKGYMGRNSKRLV